MNKLISLAGLALATAGAAHAVETDVTLSGTYGGSLTQYDNTTNGSDLDYNNNAYYYGIFATATEGDIQAFFNYERGTPNNNSAGSTDSSNEITRELYVGATHARFGTLMIGRMATEYRIAGQKLDPFYDTGVVGITGAQRSEGANYGLSNLTNGYAQSSVNYRSLNYNGFSFNVGVHPDDNATDDTDEHDFSVGAKYVGNGLYEGHGFEAGVQYLDIGSNNVFGLPGAAPIGGSALRVYGLYNSGDKWSVGLSLEPVDVDAETEKRKYAYLSGTYRISPVTTVAASYGMVDKSPAGASNFDGGGATVGIFHNVMKYMSVYAAARYVSLDERDVDTTTYAVGANFSFDVEL